MKPSAITLKTVDVSGRQGGHPRVLLVRLSAVGDCIQTMPLACAVRDAWPEAHLTWVVEKGAAPLVEANEAVDRMIVLPKRFATSPATLWELRRMLLPHRFDLSLDPQGLTKSGLVAWLSGARRRIGFARPAAREINPWLQTDRVISRATHRVDRYLELLRPLGIESPRVRFGLRIPPAAETGVRDFLKQNDLQHGFVMLNPGAGWDSKRWPMERFADVARGLEMLGVRSLVTWGGPVEQQWAQTIVSQAGGAASLAPPTSLLELAALLRQALLFVGSDTGPLHLACAVGTPSVALFGASLAAACGPYGNGNICLQRAHDQSARRKSAGADNWAMRLITVEDVLSACQKLIFSRQQGSQAA